MGTDIERGARHRSGEGLAEAPSAVITPMIADAALHLFNRGGREAGRFFGHIMTAISIADTEHLEALRTIFPAWVRAYEMGHNETYGIDRLAEIAGQR